MVVDIVSAFRKVSTKPDQAQPTKETYGEAKAEGSASRGDTVAFLGRLAGDGCGVLTEVPFDLGGQHKGKAS
jgi:hypothetical protein